MTATVLEPTVVETPEPDDELGHIVCHCTDGRIAWCGLDVSDLPMMDGDIEDETPCPLCVLADDMLESCCPWGCECTDKERYLFCGYSEGE